MNPRNTITYLIGKRAEQIAGVSGNPFDEKIFEQLRKDEIIKSLNKISEWIKGFEEL